MGRRRQAVRISDRVNIQFNKTKAYRLKYVGFLRFQYMLFYRTVHIVSKLVAELTNGNNGEEQISAIESLFVQERLWATVSVDHNLRTVTLSLAPFGNMYNDTVFQPVTF